MVDSSNILVIGLGEIGQPLFELASRHHHTVGIDIAPPTESIDKIDIMHVCYPFAIDDFVGETTRYIQRYDPRLTIINSTVSVGTTRAVAERTRSVVVSSPVRGKHAHMLEDMLFYTKFIGAMDQRPGARAAEHFHSLGMKTCVLSSPEATELAKLTETTYFGLLIAWAQEVERYCDHCGLNYDDIASIYNEVAYLPPVKYFSGVIGGHCVMPNIDILNRLGPSEILDAIQASNKKKIEREAHNIVATPSHSHDIARERRLDQRVVSES